MPEAAEVRVICEYLHKAWFGKLLLSVYWDNKSKFDKPKYAIKGVPLIKTPCRICGVYSRGKVIIIEALNADHKTIYMISQLGMEGKWTQEKGPHSNLHFYFGDLNPEKTKFVVDETWYFDDTRHFGRFNAYDSLDEPLKAHGPCLLTTALVSKGLIDFKTLRPYQLVVTVNEFKTKIKSGRYKADKEICDYLMEQKHFSGIGNYLRAEILYRGCFNPHKTVKSFTDTELETLYNSIIKQMLIAYGAKGLTIRSYWDPEGGSGKCPLQVYNREHDPLGNPVETFMDNKKYKQTDPKKQKGGRTCHWVPAVQTVL